MAESEPDRPTPDQGQLLPRRPLRRPPAGAGNLPCLPGQTSPSAAMGYGITVPIGMANDYNGYIATYREYQRGDHYRKALTAWGPHSSDYMASRLVTMGRRLTAAEPDPADRPAAGGDPGGEGGARYGGERPARDCPWRRSAAGRSRRMRRGSRTKADQVRPSPSRRTSSGSDVGDIHLERWLELHRQPGRSRRAP